jgi:hypothetical protein
MSPGRRSVPLFAALLAAACNEGPTTAVALAGTGEPLDLELTMPEITPDLLVDRRFEVFDAPGAARVFVPGDEGNDSGELTPADAGIWNAYTDLSFGSGYLEAWGEHDYLANKARIDVTAEVWHDGVVIGARTGVTENVHGLTLPWPRHIIANVIIHTDTDCGLSADAHSSHQAWWEFGLGSGPSNLGREIVPSYSTRADQPSCAPANPNPNGGGGGGSSGSDQMTCYLWLEYDLLTGEIYDAELLFCSEGG